MQLGFAMVRGKSMQPTYDDGDLLLVLHGAHVRPGAAHLLELPDGPDGPRPLSIKRVTRQDGTDDAGQPLWWVERDNPREGVDSWLVGAIPQADIQARVLWRIPRPLQRHLRRAERSPGR